MIYRAVSIGCDKPGCDAMFDGHLGVLEAEVRAGAAEEGWSTRVGEGVAGHITDYCPRHSGHGEVPSGIWRRWATDAIGDR